MAEGDNPETDVLDAPPALIDAEGNFGENWREHLDEDIRGEESLGRIHTLKDMAKSFVHAQRTIGKDNVPIPTDTSTDEEWEAFHTAGGRPATAEGYNLQRPENLPEELYDDAFAAEAQKLFHKIGLSSKQAEALMVFNADHILAGEKDYEVAETLRLKETTDALREDWGAEYGAKTHLGNVAIDQGTQGDDDLQARMVEKFGTDPDFIRFAANIGALFSEHKIVRKTSSSGETAAGIDDKIAEAMAAPAFMDKKDPQHARQVALVTELHKKKEALS